MTEAEAATLLKTIQPLAVRLSAGGPELKLSEEERAHLWKVLSQIDAANFSHTSMQNVQRMARLKEEEANALWQWSAHQLQKTDPVARRLKDEVEEWLKNQPNPDR